MSKQHHLKTEPGVFHSHFRYVVDGDVRVASRAVAASNPAAAQQILLQHVRDRAGYCTKCKRDSDTGHRVGEDNVMCSGTYESETSAEIHGGAWCVRIGADTDPAPDITININGQDFTYAQPGSKGNPCILR